MIHWLVLLACGAPAAPEPSMSNTQILDALETVTRAPPTRDAVSAALGLDLARVHATEFVVEYGSSTHFAVITVIEPTATGTAAPLMSLTLTAGCIGFEEVRARFGFAHASPAHPGAPTPPGERYVHQLATGRLTVRYVEGCLREVTFDADRG